MRVRLLLAPLLAAAACASAPPEEEAATAPRPPPYEIKIVHPSWNALLDLLGEDPVAATKNWPVLRTRPDRYEEYVRIPPAMTPAGACDGARYALLLHPETGVVWFEYFHGYLGTTEWRGPARVSLELAG